MAIDETRSPVRMVVDFPARRVMRADPSYRSISANETTQALFDRGLRMLYAGNSGEARRVFQAAAAAEPQCAMAHWGVAISFAITDNFEIFSDKSYTDEDAISAALSAPNASPRERRLIRATAERFGSLPTVELRRRYAHAMRGYAQELPDDIDGVYLSCIATFQAHAWDLSTSEAAHLIPDLDRVLQAYPSHEGAHFLRIKTLELLHRVDEGEQSAASLLATATSPGLGQLLHRAAHVQAQVKRLDAAIESNLAAMADNERYFSAGDERVTRWMRGFHGHVADTVTYQLALVGRLAEARAIAQRESPILLAMLALRERKWHEVVAMGPVLVFAYAIANARLGRHAEADDAAARLRAEPPDANMSVQLALIAAATARAQDDLAEELRQYAIAYEHSDFHYDPPLYWAYPVVEGYGAALIRAGRYDDAEQLFAATLKATPYDPYIAAGLDLARSLQNKPVDAEWLSLPLIGSWGGKLELADLG